MSAGVLPRIYFAVFDPITGAVKRTGYTSDSSTLSAQANDDEAVIEVAKEVRSASHYVDLATAEAVERPGLEVNAEYTVEFGDTVDLPQIPAGSLVMLNDGDPVSIDEEGVAFTPDRVGDHLLRVEPPFPIKVVEIQVRVE